MKGLEHTLGRLIPRRWPVRWRLAAVSAALTLIILVAFAVVVGRLTQNRLQGDFDKELRDNSTQAAARLHIGQDLTTGRTTCNLSDWPNPWDNASIRVITSTRLVCQRGQTPSRGPPHPGPIP